MAQAVSEKEWLTTKPRKHESTKTRKKINLVLYVFRVFVVKK